MVHENKIVLATGNRKKVVEMQELLKGLNLVIETIELYPGLKMPEEDRPDFTGNAVKKAEAVAAYTGEISLADDSGIEVDTLGGKPGVRSARYAGEDGNDEANNKLLLKELSGLPREKRSARFVCAIAVAVPGGKTHIVQETCEGYVADSPRGDNGFGYDPLFVYDESGLTFAEMESGEKNRISHRGKALWKVRRLLEELFKN